MSDGQRGCHPPSGNPTTYFNPPLYSDAVTKIAPSETKMPHYFLWRKANFMFNCFENKTTLFPLSDTVANNLSSIFNATFHSINFKIRYDGAVLYIDLIDKKCRVEKNPKKVLCFDGVQDYGGDVGFQNQEEEYIAVLCTAWNVEHQKVRLVLFIYNTSNKVINTFRVTGTRSSMASCSSALQYFP